MAWLGWMDMEFSVARGGGTGRRMEAPGRMVTERVMEMGQGGDWVVGGSGSGLGKGCVKMEFILS